MSVAGFLADIGTRRQIMIQRFSNGTWEELRPVIEELANQLRVAVARTEGQRERLGILMEEVERLLQESGSKISGTLRDRIMEFASDEVGFQQSAISQVSTVETVLPSREQLQAAVMGGAAELIIANQPQRLTIDQMIQRFSASNARELKNVVAAGFVAGNTTDQISARVRRKVAGRTSAQARTVVATAVNHAATQAKRAFSEANRDVLAGEEYIATLDARTTMLCASYDGQIFDVGRGPQPPMHYNCRSTRVPVPPEGSVLPGLEGERPAVVNGQASVVSGNKTFSGWLREQPVDFRDEFFSKFSNGREKRLLFDRGGLNPNDFIDPSGAQMTLAELREKHPLAFQRAGI